MPAPSILAASLIPSGMLEKNAFIRIIFQMEKQAGIIWDSGFAYRPSFVMSRNAGIIPPLNYIGISKNRFRYFLPISLLYVSG